MARTAQPMMIKGSALASTLRAVEHRYGPAGLSAVRAALPHAVRALIEPSPIPMRWYPVHTLAGIHVAVRDVLAHGSWDESHALGVAASRADFKNLYAVVIRMLNASRVWSRMERLWSIYNSRGTFEWLALGRGSMHCFIRGVDGYNLGMWNTVAGRGQQVVTMTGAKGSEVRVIRGSETEAEFKGMWLE